MDINILDKLMKTKLIHAIALVACLCPLLVSCVKSEFQTTIHVEYDSNGAKFTVKNLTTGEEMSNKGLIVSVGEIERLAVHQGDVLRLTYRPTDFTNYSWTVTYDVFGETFELQSPYSMDYTVGGIASGEYDLTCCGVLTDDEIEWQGSGDKGVVHVVVVDELNL